MHDSGLSELPRTKSGSGEPKMRDSGSPEMPRAPPPCACANGNTSTTYTYHYEDIVVVNIDPEGNIEWSQKVSKNQISKNDAGRYSGYALKVMGDKLFFIFNDNPKNLYYESGEPAVFRGNVKKAVLMLVEVDRAGNVERELLLSEDESDLYCRPKAMEVISENEMIMYTRRRKKNQLARIVFQ